MGGGEVGTHHSPPWSWLEGGCGEWPATGEDQGMRPQRVISTLCSGGLLRGSQSVGWGVGAGKVMGHPLEVL